MAFTTAEVEDGSGKSTALVFEQPATAETWLTHAARNLTSFSSLATDALKEKSLLSATVFACEIIDGRLDGVVRIKEQALPYPRVGSTSRTGRTFEGDEIPPDLLIAIRLFAEEDATSALLRHPAGGFDEIESHTTARGSIRYRAGAQSIASRYPKPWAYIRRLYDPSQRRGMWAA